MSAPTDPVARAAEAVDDTVDVADSVLDEAGPESAAPGPGTSTASGRSTVVDPLPAGLLQLRIGQQVAHYRLQALLGTGGTAKVYRGWDTRLARPVALKFLRPDRVSADRIARLLHEGRMLARLTDPSVVRIYQILEWHGTVCLVMEFVEGDTLRARLNGGGLTRPEALLVTRAVAQAVVALHAAGLMHCDLKPANVMLGKDGRPRLVDFGLAARLNRAAQGGTPLYMAPEQWRGDTQQGAADVWALGLLLIELMTGKPALSGDMASLREQLTGPMAQAPVPPAELSAPLAAILTRCLALDPAARPGPQALVDALEQTLETGPRPADSPFQGLAAFEMSAAGVFTGRDAEVAAAAEQLRRTAALLVAGASGVGKSSLVLAGVMPRLSEVGPLDIIRLRPGDQPLRRLAARLLPDATPLERDALAEELGTEAGRLEVILLARASQRGATQALVIDQLEELFTLAPPEARRPFAEALAAAVHDPGQPIRLLASIRADRYGALAEVPVLLAAFGPPMMLAPMDRARLRRAFEGPVTARGYRFDEPELVAPLIDALDGSAVALPLMQFCGEELWNQRNEDQRTLPIAGLTKGGGLAGVLQHHAESFVRALTPEGEAAVRRICVQLVGEGGTRRVVVRDTLIDGPEAEHALEQLIQSRLVVSRTDPADAGQVIELAHEALVTGWARLNRWIDGSDLGRVALQEVQGHAGFWRAEGEASHLLWSPERTKVTRTQLSDADLRPSEVVEAFLYASEAHAIQRTRRRWLIGTVVVLAVLSGLGTWLHVRHEHSLQVGNVGRFKLNVEAFDWDPVTGETTTVAPTELPDWNWHLERRTADWWHGRNGETVYEGTRPERWIEASAPVTLHVTGRGRAGETCGSSRVPLEIPGYASRDAGLKLTVRIPTCRASKAQTVSVAGGPVVVGGVGAPEVPKRFQSEERVVDVPGFSIDRYVASNAAFAVFASQVAVTGIAGPGFGGLASRDRARAEAPGHAVTRLDAPLAAAYCLWLGKRLPTDDEWVKAARGGLAIGAALNPNPKRSVPNGKDIPSPDQPEYAGPVTEPADDVSPYGVVGMASNVWEWTSTPYVAGEADWWVLRGGGWTARKPGERSLLHRNRRQIDDGFYDAGVRCVAGP